MCAGLGTVSQLMPHLPFSVLWTPDYSPFEEFVLDFFHGILIYSRTWDGHLAHLEQV